MNSEFPDRVFDVAVIGGGINGVGIARDCAMRRLSVVLLEKNDLCSGSSGACSGMLHGGARYLDTDPDVTRQSSEDSASIQRIAPNLLFRVPVLIPALKTDSPLHLEKIEAFAKAYDCFSAKKGGKPHVRLSAKDVATLEPGLARDMRGAVSLDEWGVDPFRLVILTAKSATMAGASLYTQTHVEKVETQQGKVVGITARREGHGRALIRAKTVINVAGPWAPFVDPGKMPSLRMRPSKGVHLVIDRRIANLSFVCRAIDGRRSVFLLPHEHSTLIGTTDDDFYGHPDHVSVTQDEVGYLVQAVERYFPAIKTYRITHAFAGIRPTLHRWGVKESELSRNHMIYDHAADGADGLYSMIGGQLANYRLMAQEMTDLLCRRLNRRETCQTHLETLPGCTSDVPWREEARRTGIDPITVRRLMYRHGYNAMKILDNAVKNPELSQTLCECEQVIAAEVEYCVREEWARSLADIKRRTRLASGPCQSCRCAAGTSLFLSSYLGWDSQRLQAEADVFSDACWKQNQPVLFGEQAKQQDYARSLNFLSEGAKPWIES